MDGRRSYGYGDHQTPLAFAEKVCRYLKEVRHIAPSAVVEPTCGTGAFLQSSLMFDAKEYYGIEIDPSYCALCRKTIQDDRVTIIASDFFSLSSKELIKDRSKVLIIGNPPWVTNSALSAPGAGDLLVRSNFKGMRGIDAITGASNFDVCEAVILRIIDEYKDTDAAVSMLCKTSVARNVFQELKRRGIGSTSFDVLEFDASEVFGVDVSACVLFFQLSDRASSPDICNVYDLEDPVTVRSRFGLSDGRFYSDLDAVSADFDGHCGLTWRQGVKHDCARVMELTARDGALWNGWGERVEIEPEVVFPLVKSSMFKAPVISRSTRSVIVTQKKAREETGHLEHDAPKAWRYLHDHIEAFQRRKSSIYRGAPPFSMFGVGRYSYSRYKVGVSGFYKRPSFSVLYSEDGRPVMTDDTTYFLCFDSYDMAYVAMLLLDSPQVRDLLAGIAFLDAKRPYTKKVLERIDLGRLVLRLPVSDLEQTEDALHLRRYITEDMYDSFKHLLSGD